MAAGEYVSVSTQRDSEQALLDNERHELADDAESELAELTDLYMEKGLSEPTGPSGRPGAHRPRRAGAPMPRSSSASTPTT